MGGTRRPPRCRGDRPVSLVKKSATLICVRRNATRSSKLALMNIISHFDEVADVQSLRALCCGDRAVRRLCRSLVVNKYRSRRQRVNKLGYVTRCRCRSATFDGGKVLSFAELTANLTSLSKRRSQTPSFAANVKASSFASCVEPSVSGCNFDFQ